MTIKFLFSNKEARNRNKIALKGQSGKGRMRSQVMGFKKDKGNEN